MDTETKTGIDAAKTASKKVVQKTAEATGVLIGNKIADKITWIGKPKEKEIKEIEEIYIPPEKRQQIINDLRLFCAQFYWMQFHWMQFYWMRFHRMRFYRMQLYWT